MKQVCCNENCQQGDECPLRAVRKAVVADRRGLVAEGRRGSFARLIRLLKGRRAGERRASAGRREEDAVTVKPSPEPKE